VGDRLFLPHLKKIIKKLIPNDVCHIEGKCLMIGLQMLNSGLVYFFLPWKGMPSKLLPCQRRAPCTMLAPLKKSIEDA
jgi:hypothetical protein